MRITLLSPTFGGVSGVGRFTSELASKLIEHGHEVTVISTNNTFYLPIRSLKNLTWAFFAQFKRKHNPDIVHAMNPISYVSVRRSKSKRVLTLHGVYQRQIEFLHGKQVGAASSYLEGKALDWADAIVAVSRATCESYKTHGHRVIYIPNAVDSTRLPKDAEVLRPNQVVFVGRLSREKGIDCLIEAAQILGDVNFVVVGDGPERPKLEKAQKSNLVFLGPQPWTRTISLIRGSKCLVLPSLQEGLPTVILESMAVGTPVVASRVGGIPEIITHGTNGLLIEPGDVQGLRQSIELLLYSEAERTRISQIATERVKEEYDWSRIADQYLTVYRRLLNQN